MVKDADSIIVDMSAVSTARYQSLLNDIGKLKAKSETKKGLTNKEKKKLEMFQDELAAINKGVMADQLDEYMAIYKSWWELDRKSVRTVAENKTYRELTEKKLEIEDTYTKNKEKLEQELKDAQRLREEKVAAKNKSEQDIDDLEQSKIRKKAEIEESYKTQIGNLDKEYILSTGNTYLNWKKDYDKVQDTIKTYDQKIAAAEAIINDPNASNKKKKQAQKDLESYKKKKAAKEEELKKYQKEEAAFIKGATAANFAEYKKAYEYISDPSQYLKKDGTYKNKTLYDSYVEKINQWNTAKQNQRKSLITQQQEALNKSAQDIDDKIREIRAGMNDFDAESWTELKNALELHVQEFEQEVAYLEAVASKYETVANILAETDLDTIKKYNLSEILGIDTDTSISDLLTNNLEMAIEAAKDKLSKNSEIYDAYSEIIEAAKSKKFSKVLDDEFRAGLTKEALDYLDLMIEQANKNDWEGNTWVYEWEQRRSQLISDVSSDIKRIQELKDEFRETVVFKAVRDAIDSLENLNNRLSAMSNIINNDWVQDENGLTEYGRAKIMLLANEAQNAQQIVQNAAKHIQEVEEAQLNENTKYANESEYQKALTEAWSEYSNALQNVYSIDNEIYELSKKQQEAEVNRLNKVIDLRKKALANKKAYYDYDKTIKSKTKNIEALEAELKALNGVNDAASKARIKQLQSDLADAREDLEDTKKEHEYDMQINALDKLLEDYSESLDNSAKSIKDTFEQWAQQIKDAIDASSGVDVDDILNSIASFLMGNHINVPTATVQQTPDVVSDDEQDEVFKQWKTELLESAKLNPELSDIVSKINNSLSEINEFKEIIQSRANDSTKYESDEAYKSALTTAWEDYIESLNKIHSVSSDISSGNLVSLTDTQISNNYLEKLVEMSSMTQNTLNDIVSNTRSITNKLFESSIDVIPKYEDVYSSRLYDTVQSIDSKFNGSMSDLINATNKAGTSQQVSFTLPKNMTTSQLNNLFNQLKKLGVNFVYK